MKQTMSDMLQLVVKIIHTQVMILSSTSHIDFATPDDKLKHVGHLLSLANPVDKLKHVGQSSG